MVATMTCQANSLIKFGKAKPAGPSNVPLQQPLGYSRPQTATFASSGALAYGSDFISATVRKASSKLEEFDSEEMMSSFLGKREKPSVGQPVFRSALEQVSYETNAFLSQGSNGKPRRQTVVGRVAKMFGR